MPRRRPAGQRPRPSAAGLHLLPHGRVLRRRGPPAGPTGPASGARPASPMPRRCSTRRSSGSRCPSNAGRFPGYLVRPARPGRIGAGRPTLVAVGGFDSSAEELYFQLGAPGPSGGGTSFVFDGPGQPGCMRTNPTMTFRPDYEVPLARRPRPPGRSCPTSMPTGWPWPARASAPTSPPAARPPTSGSGPWWPTRRSSTWAATWRPGSGPTSTG